MTGGTKRGQRKKNGVNSRGGVIDKCKSFTGINAIGGPLEGMGGKAKLLIYNHCLTKSNSGGEGLKYLRGSGAKLVTG